MDSLTRLKSAVPPLLEWFRRNKRVLPWRKNRNLYTALVAELMLQQTRVEAVKERYVQFLTRFPTPEALAAASEDEVLKMWEGLGYYTRARNLHAAAKKLVSEGIPRTWVGVKSLPGVGEYTAGAICSTALGLPEPAVDGNVLRILTRLLGCSSNIDEISTKKKFSELLRAVYPPQAADFCEGLMELGALVCVPNGQPMCGACPWEGLCKAHLEGKETAFPVRSEKRARKIVNAIVCVLEREGRFALEKRKEKGLLAGLWQFPFFEGEAPDLGEIVQTKQAKHVFTHVEWHMTGRLIRASACYPQYVWLTAEEIKRSYALPSAFKAFFPWLDNTQGF